MPPYSETTRMSPILQDEEVALSAKARERDLLAIIANKDKRIQQLEQKLEAQSAFIEAVLKLSDHYKAISNNNSNSKSKGKRRVSWSDNIEQSLVPLSPSNTDQVGLGQIVDVDEDDNVSVLSEEGDNQAVDVDSIGASVKNDAVQVFDDVKINAANRMAISKFMAMNNNVANAEGDNGEVDLDAIIAARTKAKKQSTGSGGVVDIDEISASTKAKQSDKKFDKNLHTTEAVQKKVKPSKLERKLIQSIIEKIRNDDDSVDV